MKTEHFQAPYRGSIPRTRFTSLLQEEPDSDPNYYSDLEYGFGSTSATITLPTTIFAVALAALILLLTTPDTSLSASPHKVRALHGRGARTVAHRKAILRKIFGRYGSQAIRVAQCESGLRPWAQNGQYLGIFQMGTAERTLYGHGRGAWAQATAAHAYFLASGSDWSPWQCQP